MYLCYFAIGSHHAPTNRLFISNARKSIHVILELVVIMHLPISPLYKGIQVCARMLYGVEVSNISNSIEKMLEDTHWKICRKVPSKNQSPPTP